jgi:hypothetical protein
MIYKLAWQAVNEPIAEAETLRIGYMNSKTISTDP